MPYRAVSVTGLFQQSRQIEMRVRKRCVDRNAALIRGQRILHITKIFICNAEIECGSCMERVGGKRVLVQICSLGRPAFFVEHASEVDERIGMVRIDGEGLHVGILRVATRCRLELDTELEPFISGVHAIAV